jgi:sulfide dehydrogenase cytochrome subunit
MTRISDRSTSKLVAVALAAVATAAAAVVSAEPPPGAAGCSGCHPTSTRVISPVPRLAGLDRAAIVKAMQEFRSGTRAATVMDRIAKGFTDDEIQAIAAWYATQR